LSFHPRGLLGIIGGADLELLKRQIFRAIATGNHVLIAAPELTETDKEAFLQDLLKSGAALEFIRFSEAGNKMDVLSENIQGVIADGPERDEAARRLCLREGAILPILSIHDDIERYFIERTRTIDTTAAGGNASLLAM